MFNSTKKIVFALFAVLLISSFSYAQDNTPVTTPTTDTPVPMDVETPGNTEKNDTQSGGIQYGEQPKSTATNVTFIDLVISPEKYENMEVVVTGNVNDVCAKEGCWMILGNGDKEILIKTLHVFVVPKDCYDNTAVVNGVFNVKEISE